MMTCSNFDRIIRLIFNFGPKKPISLLVGGDDHIHFLASILSSPSIASAPRQASSISSSSMHHRRREVEAKVEVRGGWWDVGCRIV